MPKLPTAEAFDVMVIGAGSAGRYGAKAAAEGGAKVGLVEVGPFGGLCILKGCMPTKAYLRSAEIAAFIKNAPKMGIHPEGQARVDFTQIKTRKDRLIAEMAGYAKSGIEDDPEITLLYGPARFLSPTALQVGETRYICENYLIATGSRAVIPPFPGIDEVGFMTSDAALDIETLPASIMILGGGAEALEFGQFFNRMGLKTTLLQRSAHILSQEDHDVGEALADSLRADGMNIQTGVSIEKIAQEGEIKRVSFRQGEKQSFVEAEALLVATGRTGNTDSLQLDLAGVVCGRSGIRVNDFLQTSNPKIYAAGDVTGLHMVVNVATYQGRIAGENLVKGPVQKADYRVIPSAIFTDPQYARVGLSEREAQAKGIPVQVGKYPFDDLGKAIVTNQTEGFIKILAEPKSGEILGVQILGAEASNLIHQATVAMHYRSTLEDYARIAHIHPTLSEIMVYLVEEMIEA